jgi:hypothetical protein
MPLLPASVAAICARLASTTAAAAAAAAVGDFTRSDDPHVSVDRRLPAVPHACN